MVAGASKTVPVYASVISIAHVEEIDTLAAMVVLCLPPDVFLFFNFFIHMCNRIGYDRPCPPMLMIVKNL